jgi:hypothetical protein
MKSLMKALDIGSYDTFYKAIEGIQSELDELGGFRAGRYSELQVILICQHLGEAFILPEGWDKSIIILKSNDLLGYKVCQALTMLASSRHSLQ